MLSRDLRIALLIALGIHVFFMTAVVIVNPALREKIKPYSRVDFLGPLLKKTAFDIMLESANPVMRTSYSQALSGHEPGYLKAVPPERQIVAEEFSQYYLDPNYELPVLDFLTGSKSVPVFLLETGRGLYMPAEGGIWKRRVIHKPDPPVLMRRLYDNKEMFQIKIRALVSAEGMVRSAEPVTTSGHPPLDIIAAKFVRGWMFEPKPDTKDNDEWQEVDVILKTADQ